MLRALYGSMSKVRLEIRPLSASSRRTVNAICELADSGAASFVIHIPVTGNMDEVGLKNLTNGFVMRVKRGF